MLLDDAPPLRVPSSAPGVGGADAPTMPALAALPHAVLIDLGSAAPARVSLPTRGDALRLLETAQAHSSPPYRAPELWDPPTGGAVGEATDSE